MNDFLSSLTEHFPWLKPVVTWLVAWLVISFPAYLILPIVEAASAKVSAFAARAAACVLAWTARLSTVREENERQVVEDYAVRLARDERHAMWQVAISEISAPLERLDSALGETRREVVQLNKRLRSLDFDGYSPIIPDANALPKLSVEHRSAWGNLIFSAAVVLACMAVNVGMLQQIILGLGIIPEHLTYLGLPLAGVFAWLLTFFETGVGFSLGQVFAKAEVEGRRLSGGVLLTVSLATAVAIVEGFFYSQIAGPPQQGDEVQLPLLGVTMSQRDVFFIWGSALVGGLMLFGALLHGSLHMVLRSGTTGRLRRQLHAMTVAATDWKEDLGAVDEALTKAVDLGASVDEGIGRYEGKVAETKKTIQSIMEASERTSMEPMQRVSPSDARMLLYRSGFWLAVTLASGFVVVKLASPAPSAIAILVVSMAIGVGLRSASERLHEPLVTGASKWHRIVTGVATAGLVLTILGLLVGSRWLIAIGVALVLLLCGFEGAELLGFISLYFRWARDIVLTIIGWLAVAALHATRLACLVLAWALVLAAAPLTRIFDRGREGEHAQ
jgi:hypothetical protein